MRGIRGTAVVARAVLLFAAVLATSARAQDVQLPRGEDAADWAPALDLAGLRIATTGAPAVTLTPAGTQWVVEVVDHVGRVRTAHVVAPRTPAEREEVALVAAGLVRPVRAGSAPPPPPFTLPTPPPPPPSRAASAEPLALAEEPEEAPTVPTVVVPKPREPAPSRLPSQRPDGRADLEEDLAILDAAVARARPRPSAPVRPRLVFAVLRPEPLRSREPFFIAPPLEVGLGISARPRTQAGFAVSFGMRPLRAGFASGGVCLGLVTPRNLRHGPQIRTMTQVEAVADAEVDLWGVSAGPMVGIAWHAYGQQLTLVDSVLTGLVGARGAARLLWGQSWRLVLDAQVRWDTVGTMLVGPAGLTARSSRWELRMGFRGVFGRRSDPIQGVATSSR